MPKIREFKDGVQVIRDYQRRKDMEKAKTVVNLVFSYVVVPVAALVIIRKIDKKFP